MIASRIDELLGSYQEYLTESVRGRIPDGATSKKLTGFFYQEFSII
jgi:hypothetical protein